MPRQSKLPPCFPGKIMCPNTNDTSTRGHSRLRRGTRSSREGQVAPNDPGIVLADFRAYSDAHLKVDATFKDHAAWARMAILNTARMGKFSSDRTIAEYASEIWKLDAVKV